MVFVTEFIDSQKSYKSAKFYNNGKYSVTDLKIVYNMEKFFILGSYYYGDDKNVKDITKSDDIIFKDNKSDEIIVLLVYLVRIKNGTHI